MAKIVKMFYDVETTGLDFKQHSIHQLSGLIEVNDEIVETFDFKVRPHPRAKFEPVAMNLAGKTKEEMMVYPTIRDTHKAFTAMVGKYIDKFDKRSKAYLCGFNNRHFDDDFLRMFFTINKDDYFPSYFWADSLDVMVLAAEYLIERRTEMPTFKLKRVALELGLEVEKESLHDSVYDSMLTREIYRIVTNREIEL